MSKSTALRASVQTAIGKYRKANPKTSWRLIADKFGCSVNQARYANELYVKGEVGNTRNRKREKKIAEFVDINKDKSPQEIVEEMLHTVSAEIQANTNLTASDKIKLLKDLTATIKGIQSLELVAHIKNPDVEIIKAMCLKLKPNMTDRELLDLYYSVKAEK